LSTKSDSRNEWKWWGKVLEVGPKAGKNTDRILTEKRRKISYGEGGRTYVLYLGGNLGEGKPTRNGGGVKKKSKWEKNGLG